MMRMATEVPLVQSDNEALGDSVTSISWSVLTLQDDAFTEIPSKTDAALHFCKLGMKLFPYITIELPGNARRGSTWTDCEIVATGKIRRDGAGLDILKYVASKSTETPQYPTGAESLMTILKLVRESTVHCDVKCEEHTEAEHTLPAKFKPETVIILPAYAKLGDTQAIEAIWGGSTIWIAKGVSAAKVAGLVNRSLMIQAPFGVEGPMTMVAVVFDVIKQDDAFTPQTKAEQFWESGRKLAPEMKTVAFR
jgi:hypothetical protein